MYSLYWKNFTDIYPIYFFEEEYSNMRGICKKSKFITFYKFEFCKKAAYISSKEKIITSHNLTLLDLTGVLCYYPNLKGMSLEFDLE